MGEGRGNRGKDNEIIVNIRIEKKKQGEDGQTYLDEDENADDYEGSREL